MNHRLLLLPLAGSLLLAGCARPVPVFTTITGTVACERTTRHISVRLLDATDPAGAPRVVAMQDIDKPAACPAPFALLADPLALQGRGRFLLDARLSGQDDTLSASTVQTIDLSDKKTGPFKLDPVPVSR